jgi:acetyl esterase/lipase
MSSTIAMRKTLCISILSVLFMLDVAAYAQAPDPSNFTTKSGIKYAQGVSGALKADAYIPDGKGAFPAILFIHGGGWANGDRNQMVRLVKGLANQGYVGFTIEYDVDPTHFPVSLDESLAALTYMQSNAKQLHIDPTRIAVAGSSAGGELAALVALTPRTHATPAVDVPPVQAAIILNGVLDLESLGDKSQMVTDYLGGPCSTLPAACKAASPAAQVRPDAPYFFVGHGTADKTVPFAQAEAFVAALHAAHVQVRFFVAQGGPHTYWIKDRYYAPNLADIISFLSIALHPHKS